MSGKSLSDSTEGICLSLKDRIPFARVQGIIWYYSMVLVCRSSTGYSHGLGINLIKVYSNVICHGDMI